MAIFKKSVWVMLTIFFTILLVISIVGAAIAGQYSANINSIFGINSYQKVTTSGEAQDTEYFKSDYYKADGKTYDDDAMRKNSLKQSQEVAADGSVLLWNNGATLPIKKDSKVSLFGVSSVEYLHTGSGSGYIGIATTETIKSALEEKNLSVNPKLWNAYRLNRTLYGRKTVTNPEITDPNYAEFTVGEVPWSALDTTSVGNVTSTINQYGDAAIMIISRNGSENADTAFKAAGHLNESYMDLSEGESDILTRLAGLKEAGKIKKIVLLINSANAMQMQNITGRGIDACVWVGMGGSASYRQIGSILSGEIAPAGHLVDTYVYDSESAPATENWGDYTFTSSAGVPPTTTYTHNTKYVVYQEGIYVGYRYYETRYEDSVIGGRNAASESGVKNGQGNWKYSDEVAFPFGHGLTYTDFEYSGFSVNKKGADYEVEMTIKNTGAKYSGSETLQVYLQKPYTEYDITNKIEKSAVELAGFAKTGNIAPGKSETLKVTVKGEDFKTYDAYGKKTYILEKGKYYIAAGKNAHDALNNILAKKGYTTANGMDAAGNAGFAHEVEIKSDDYEKYSVSSVTGNSITNRFDNADINLYAGTADQKITYLSRNDWKGTYPSAVSMKCTSATMVADMQYGIDPPVQDGDVMPLYETIGEMGELTLAMLMESGYNDPAWEDLLNQMTWEEQNLLCTYGSNAIGGAESVSAPGAKAKDGPGGIGILNPNLTSLMCFPSEVLMASTWDTALVQKLGDAFGMEILHVDNTGIYAPGANIHRSAYSGRAWEYYSEDGFLSGKMFAAETTGLQNRGTIVFTKHYVLNDQEYNRYGGSVWANEQSIREVYLKAFELGIVEGKANGMMSSFNRIGCTWSGKHKGLMTEIPRNEWGFVGVIETDAGVGSHMLDPKAMAEAVVAGQDIWMSGGSTGAFNNYKNNPTVCKAIRESCHRILYTQLHSNAMNGMSRTDKVVKVIPWWQTALTALQIGVGAITGVCLTLAVLSFVITPKVRKY